MTDLAELKALAEAAKQAAPSPWRYRPNEFDDWGTVRSAQDEKGRGWTVARCCLPHASEDEKAAHRSAGTDPWHDLSVFIAAANPSAVLSLIERVERAEGERDISSHAYETALASVDAAEQRGYQRGMEDAAKVARSFDKSLMSMTPLDVQACEIAQAIRAKDKGAR